MKAIIAGASGMVGGLVLEQCLTSDAIDEVVSLQRKPLPTGNHAKLTMQVLADFEDYSEHTETFKNVDMVFFCIGAYTGEVADELFKKITIDYALACATALQKSNPQATFCLLSGAGADRSEQSKTDFARFKGIAENKIAELGLNFYAFRPGYIYPVTPRNEPNFLYKLSRFLYPLIKLFGENVSIKSTELAQVMFHVGCHGADKEILENKDIKQLTRENT